MARTLQWSGYTWDLRTSTKAESPGPCYWSDSEANVFLNGSELVLKVVKDGAGHWTCPELDCQKHLGYGAYRWVVNTDLTQVLDANAVLGLFTYGGNDPSNNEIDIEPSHWGNLAWDNGSVTVWQNADTGANKSKTHKFTNKPPYVLQFDWQRGSVHWHITDATGAVLLDWTVTSGVPTPSSEVPMINWWRFNGKPPVAESTVALARFDWAVTADKLPALDRPPDPPPPPPPPADDVFIPGERVKVTKKTSKYYGMTGTVVSATATNVKVHFDPPTSIPPAYLDKI